MRVLRNGWTIILLTALWINVAAAGANLHGLITAVRGNVVELSIGSADGVKRGMVFVTKTQTTVTARFEVTAVSPNRSTARVLQKADVVIVGDAVELVEGAAQGQPVIVTPPVTTPPRPPAPVVPPPPSAEPKAAAVNIKAAITSIEDDKVSVSAGRMDGLEAGMSVTLSRSAPLPSRLGSLYLDRVEAQQSTGKLFNVERGAFLSVGDEITLTYQPPEGGVTAPPIGPPEARLPKLPQFTVPRTERTYDLLGALAGEGLIKKYPARVFHEDAPFESRAEGSIVFNRAQVAGLINEALENLSKQSNESVAHSSIVALNQLVREYEKEMRALRPDFESVQAQLTKAQETRSRYGFGGFLRFGNVSSSGGGIPPRTERTPADSAFDMRINLFANVNRKTTFWGQFDTNSDDPAGRSANVRRALLRVDDAVKLPLLGRVQIEVGRGDFWYGVGRFGTLLLSDAGGPYDYVKARYRIGSDFTYEGFASLIGEDPRKNLYGHRLEARVGNNVRLGVAETILAADQRWSGTFLLTTLVPTLPLVTVDRALSKGNANTNPVAILYVEANAAEGFQLYSEVLLDDVVIREREPGAHRTGFLLGAQGYLAKNPLKFNGRLEFVHLQPGVYQTTRVIDNYFRGDRSIGYLLSTADPRARGVNNIHVELNYMPIKKLTLGIGAEIADLGADDPMLSRQNILRLRALYDVAPNLAVGLRAVRVSTTNDNFVPNAFGRLNRLEFHLLRTF